MIKGVSDSYFSGCLSLNVKLFNSVGGAVKFKAVGGDHFRLKIR